MGGGDGMSETAFVAALGRSTGINKQSPTIPPSLLCALRVLDQEKGEDTERGALGGVVDSLVEWFLNESRSPRSGDGACVLSLPGAPMYGKNWLKNRPFRETFSRTGTTGQ